MSAPLEDPRRVDPVLLRKYDVQGPRYTSYPPAPHFAPLNPDDLFARWRGRNGLTPDPGLSMYLHIPFCRTRCLFCGCHTFGRVPAEQVDTYIGALLAEMDLARAVVDPGRPVRQVALGGGTPSFLDESQLERLLGGLEQRWNLATDGERSVEMDPRTVTPEKLEVFLAHGFNRFSLGIQDFNPEVLKAVGRAQTIDKVTAAVSHLRNRGIEAINFDLIYGLPGQGVASAMETAARVVEFRPSRIAVYSFANIPWIHPHQLKMTRAAIPDADTKMAIGLTFAEAFLAAGYRQVGMDHYALPDDPLVTALDNRTLRRTFMGYTTGRGLDNLGFGASAISWVGASYSQSEKDLIPYLEAIDKGRLPVVRGHLLSPDDEIRQNLLLELFCTFQTDLDSLAASHGIDAGAYFADELEQLRPMVEDGLCTVVRNAIRLTESGRFFVRNVCMVFDRYLEREPHQRRYSRTV